MAVIVTKKVVNAQSAKSTIEAPVTFGLPDGYILYTSREGFATMFMAELVGLGRATYRWFSC